jgi:hypothetical protein
LLRHQQIERLRQQTALPAISVASSIAEACRELINHLHRWKSALSDNSIQNDGGGLTIFSIRAQQAE